MVKLIARFFVCVFLLTSCQTYYTKNKKFNDEFTSGHLEQAEKTLEKNSKEGSGKERFLYFVNQGVVLQLLGKYEESNVWFEKAYIFTEDYQKNYVNEALTFLVNPTTTVYPAEDHERFYVLYYKAVNYLKLGSHDAALVECRRLNNLVNRLSDKYKSKNKFKADAFIHNLIGLIYDADGDVNNAFIAYRNALKIYDGSYTADFGLGAPEQLKKDLLRTAYLNGFDEELRKFEHQFGMKYKHTPMNGQGDVVFLWGNGLGPVKDEWGINFIITESYPGVVVFQNVQQGLSFPFPIPAGERSGIEGLKTVRVVFPKYVERPVYFGGAELVTQDGQRVALEKVEDVNAISFKILKERMLWTFGKTLLRVALKQVAAYELGKESKGLGVAAQILGAVSEKADTRNWQTLPHSIYYARIRMPEGKNGMSLNLYPESGGTAKHDISVDIKAGQTQFKTFSSLEVNPAFYQQGDNGYRYGY
ncbi:hypothetical protein FUAX_14340 [Fulvitalea axinellae]|uniref:Tetratricopeptide repeat protein n=1 Tax=Fulvitalea axinellae TaxID=1182444 RepID=A0AAU9CPX9_9BACT|nr:hypothetical protein FUAX_14340 [Fulvitalea axinellae]